MGSYSSGYFTNNYKYDSTTNTYTKNTDIPYIFYYGSVVAIGNDIYLLGNTTMHRDSGTNNYKYDITTDTYSKNTDIPYKFCETSAVAIGNDIYLLGSIDSGCYINNYKYNTIDDTYIKNKSIPYSFYHGSAVAIGTNIYLLGSSNSIYRKYNYKYTTTINTTNCIIKKTNHSIYTQSESYTSTNASIVEIGDEYYTEYNNNNIVTNTAPISSDCNTKMYIKSGAILNGKTVNVDTEGWNTVNLLDYI